MTALRAENVVFGYRRDAPVLRGVSVAARPGAVTALFGPNGCGKSTLLRCLNGSLTPQAGRVALGAQPVSALTACAIARAVAVVPQDTPTDAPFTVRQMVMLGRYAHGDGWRRETAADGAVVDDCLARLGVRALADRLFAQLSGGERQRVVVARALAQQGRVLLLDEPAAHLDIAHQLALYALVRGLARDGQAVLMVCHDVLIAPMFADECVLMAAGAILAAGRPAAVMCPARLEAAYGCRMDIAWPEAAGVQARFGGCGAAASAEGIAERGV